MVYVDNYGEVTGPNFGRMAMSHIWADSQEELLAMIVRIGVQTKWIQHKGTLGEHFDIALNKRAIAIRYGAKSVNFRDYGRAIQNRAYKAGVHYTLCSRTKCNTKYEV